MTYPMPPLANWAIVAAATAVFPVIAALYRRQLGFQIEEIEERLLRAQALVAYSHRHLPGIMVPPAGRPMDGRLPLRAMFLRHFGYEEYVLPCVMISLCTAVAWLTGLSALGADLGIPGALASSVTASSVEGALWGFLGAYVWGLQDAIRRYRSTDLTPTALHWTWLRMLAAAAVATAAGGILRPPVEPLVAFGIGTFPMQALTDFLRTRAQKGLGLAVEATPAEPPTLQLLQGATPVVIARLEEEDIHSVQELAYEDPTRLYLRSSIKWNVIIDLIDQALLALYVERRLPALRGIGVRSAIEVATIEEMLRSNDAAEREQATAMVSLIAQKLDKAEAAVRYLLKTISEDPQVTLVWRLWSTSHPDAEPEGEAP